MKNQSERENQDARTINPKRLQRLRNLNKKAASDTPDLRDETRGMIVRQWSAHWRPFVQELGFAGDVVGGGTPGPHVAKMKKGWSLDQRFMLLGSIDGNGYELALTFQYAEINRMECTLAIQQSYIGEKIQELVLVTDTLTVSDAESAKRAVARLTNEDFEDKILDFVEKMESGLESNADLD